MPLPEKAQTRSGIRVLPVCAGYHLLKQSRRYIISRALQVTLKALFIFPFSY